MTKPLVENRQARHNYAIKDTLEAGIVLEGWEVKAIRAGQATFNGGAAYVRLAHGEAWLESMTITPIASMNMGLLEPRQADRARKLLLSKQELTKLGRSVTQKGFTVVPLSLTPGRRFKLQIGLAQGKNNHDKRETVRQRDQEREIARSMTRR